MTLFTRRRLFQIAVALGAIVLLAQLVPYGGRHINPPVVAEPPWDSPETRALAKRACFDCHSNETVWPGYARVAPVSWLVQHDVDEGRAELNFSEWNRLQKEAKESGKVVREGEMPPWPYAFMHAGARLTDAEVTRLVAGLDRTIAPSARPDD